MTIEVLDCHLTTSTESYSLYNSKENMIFSSSDRYISSLDRRNFVKNSAKISSLILAGVLLPTLSKQAESYGFVIKILGAVAVGFLSNMLYDSATGGSKAEASTHTNTNEGDVIWHKDKGGIVESTILNTSQFTQNSRIKVSLWNDEDKPALESQSVIFLEDIPPNEELVLRIWQKKLPSLGKKTFSVDSGLNVEQTKHSIIVVD